MTPVHPAAEVAMRSVGDQFTVAATIERHGIVAVLLEDAHGRAVTAVVQQSQHEWVAPEVLVGGRAVPTSRRSPTTSDGQPLILSSRKQTRSADAKFWYTIVGLAAEDASSVTLESELDRVTVPVSANGLVFALVRVREDQKPAGVVRTHDGRAISFPI